MATRQYNVTTHADADEENVGGGSKAKSYLPETGIDGRQPRVHKQEPAKA
ncbi:MAG TPA: hypothetical protein VFI02_06045 [Armatimonadota bacterium]|nr:hypothetical protein [Armatimonadota bacterium]